MAAAAWAAVAGVVLAAATAHADAQWRVSIRVAEVGGAARDLVFGVDPLATDGVDNGRDGTVDLGEREQPPPPPAGCFDVRWASQLLLDLRRGSSPATPHRLALSIQRAAGGDILLAWDRSAVAARTSSAVLQDPFGGVLGIDVDMRAQDTLTVTHPAITSLALEFTSVDPYCPYTRLSVVQAPAAAISGQVLAPPLWVLAEDDQGVGAEQVQVTVAKVAGPGMLAGTLTRTTDAAGVARFADLVYTATAAGEMFALQATADHPAGPIATPPIPIRCDLSVLTSLVVVQTPAWRDGSQPMAPPLWVQAADAAGTSMAGVSVTVSRASGSGTLGGTLTQTTGAGGLAVFADLVYMPAAPGESFSLRASATTAGGQIVSVTTGPIARVDGDWLPPPLAPGEAGTDQAPAPSPPVLYPVGPAVAPTRENQTPLLRWAPAAGVAAYELDLGTIASDCQSVADDVAVADTVFQSPRLSDGRYCWRVRSVLPSGVGDWSAESTFDVIPALGPWGSLALAAAMAAAGALFLGRRGTQQRPGRAQPQQGRTQPPMSAATPP